MRGLIDAPAAWDLASAVEEQARMLSASGVLDMSPAAKEYLNGFEAVGKFADHMSAATGDLNDLTTASKFASLVPAAEEYLNSLATADKFTSTITVAKDYLDGVASVAAVAQDHFNDLTAAGKLTNAIAALGLTALPQPLLGDDLARYADAFREANTIDSALLEKMEALGATARANLDFAPYERLQNALGAYGALEQFPVGGLAGGFLSDRAWNQMARDFDRLKDSYAEMLLDPVSLRLPLVADLHLPEIDVATHYGLLHALESEEDDLAPAAKDVLAEVPERAIRQVEAISPRLGVKLRSAFANLRSADPQTASNACLAIRQVFMGLLRKLAPEDRVRPWAKLRNDPELFKQGDVNNETSYRARILYLSRFDLDERSEYSTFLVHNATSLVTLIRIVNREVHDESPDEPPVILTPGRVEHLLLRAASAFDEIIVCANVQKRMDGRTPP